jgi:hypothetical protein
MYTQQDAYLSVYFCDIFQSGPFRVRSSELLYKEMFVAVWAALRSRLPPSTGAKYLTAGSKQVMSR